MARPAHTPEGAPDYVVELSSTPSEIGRRPGLAIFIDSDQVSDLHASVVVGRRGVMIRDLGSDTGTLVNNQPIETETRLSDGDWVSVGPFALLLRGNRLSVYPRGQRFQLVARGLCRAVTTVDERTGEPDRRPLLDGVSLSIEPCEFTAIIGPSGSGKSTLLNAISGRVPADTGQVEVNGRDLIGEFESLKQHIVLIPQKEAVHDSLTISRAITHTARLRLPANRSGAAVRRETNRVLRVVGLGEDVGGRPIRRLSGGELKRVCLANELVGNPEVVFLDEVTSGLDEEADRDMMALFRQLAEDGKTVVGITHNLGHVEQFCHRVVVLAPGGRLAFVGTPAAALAHFDVSRLGDVYAKLAADPTGWQKRYQVYESSAGAQPLPLSDGADGFGAAAPRSALGPMTGAVVRQSLVLARRYLDLQWADKLNLATMLGVSLLVAFLLVVVFGDVRVGAPPDQRPAADRAQAAAKAVYMTPRQIIDQTAATVEREAAARFAAGLDYSRQAQTAMSLLFLLEFSCLWFGCNNAAKEVIKEATVYRLERNFNLSPLSYYLSKVFVLVAITLVQAVVLFVPVKLFCQPPGDPILQFLTLALMSVLGVLLGLLISCVANTTDVAAGLVPIVLIPQFILGGTAITLTGAGKGLAMAVGTSYWGHNGVMAALPDAVVEAAGQAPFSWFLSHLILCLHAGVFVAGALVLLRAKDRGASTTDMIRLARAAIQNPNGPAAKVYRAIREGMTTTTNTRR